MRKIVNIPFRKEWLVGLVIVIFGIIYLAVVVSNHYFFRTFCYDYGVYNNAFYDLAHLHINQNPLFDPPLERFCQVHISFLLNIFSPILYWTLGLATKTYALLVFQVLMILTGGYFTFRLIEEKTHDYWFSLLGLIHFFFLWGHFSALSADYIDTTIGASLVPVFLYYHVRRKFLLTSIVFVFILITKENFPLWLVFISLTLILLESKDKLVRRINLIYIAVAILYFIMIFKLVIPAIEDPDRPYWGFAYSAVGDSPSQAILFSITHPFETLKLLFINHTGDPTYNGIKMEFYSVFLISGGIVLIANPRYLIMFVPIIAQKMFNDHYLRWGINSFYSIEVVSILSLAVYLTLMKLKNKKLAILFAILICLSTITITINKLENRKSLFYLPEKERFYDMTMYQSEFNIRKINGALKRIPPDAKVSASERIVPHLAFRSGIYCFPQVGDAEFIVLLFGSGTYPVTKEKFDKEKEKYLQDTSWRTIYDEYPLLILKKEPVILRYSSFNLPINVQR